MRIHEKGQAVVETAVMLPILILFFATIIDGGLYLVTGQNVVAAADSVARQVEAEPSMTQAQAQSYLEDMFPGLPGATVSVAYPTRDTEALAGGYKVWDAGSNAFLSRPTEVSWDKRDVKVTYTGKWTTPVTMISSQMVVGTAAYTIESETTAVMDATFETW